MLTTEERYKILNFCETYFSKFEITNKTARTDYKIDALAEGEVPFYVLELYFWKLGMGYHIKRIFKTKLKNGDIKYYIYFNKKGSKKIVYDHRIGR